MIFITPHAVKRFQERVAPLLSLDQARAAILAHQPAIEKAADFRCGVVKLGDGSRLVLTGRSVTTVYGRKMLPRQCRRGQLS